MRGALDGGESAVLPVPTVSEGAWAHLARWQGVSNSTSRFRNTSPIGRGQRQVSRPSGTGWPWLRRQPDPAHLYVSELTALSHCNYSVHCVQNSPSYVTTHFHLSWIRACSLPPAWLPILALPPTGCVTSGKLLSLSLLVSSPVTGIIIAPTLMGY